MRSWIGESKGLDAFYQWLGVKFGESPHSDWEQIGWSFLSPWSCMSYSKWRSAEHTNMSLTSSFLFIPQWLGSQESSRAWYLIFDLSATGNCWELRQKVSFSATVFWRILSGGWPQFQVTWWKSQVEIGTILSRPKSAGWNQKVECKIPESSMDESCTS